MKTSASEQVQLWLAGLPPQTKQRVRSGLRALADRQTAGLDVKPLRGELEGFYRLRVGDFRVIYSLHPGPVLRLEYADIRDTVYEAYRVLRQLREEG